MRGLIVSCDTFFFTVSVRSGIRALDRFLQNFAFGKPTGIDLPNELGGLVPTPEWKRKAKGQSWYTGDTVPMGIGQGYLLVTPLQLVQGISIIANHGLKPQPHLLLKSQLGTHVSATAYRLIQQVTLEDPKIWDYVISALQQVVMKAGGTAYNGFGGSTVSYTVAGKQVRLKWSIVKAVKTKMKIHLKSSEITIFLLLLLRSIIQKLRLSSSMSIILGRRG